MLITIITHTRIEIRAFITLPFHGMGIQAGVLTPVLLEPNIMIVRFRHKNSNYPNLTAGKQYAVIGIEADDLRLLNDQGDPYLYPIPADFLRISLTEKSMLLQPSGI